MGITINIMDALSDFNLKDILPGKKAEDLMGEASADALADSAALVVQNTVTEMQERAASPAKDFQNHSGQADNMLARNFADASGGDSRYLKAALSSFQIERQLQMSQKNAVTGFLASYRIDAGEYDTPAAASMAMRRKSDRESFEANQENLDEIRKNIERNAEEAMAPKDAEGKPIPGAAETVPPALSPEAPDLSPAAAPVSEPAAEAAASEAAPAAAPVPEPAAEAAAPAPPDVSIDIRV